MLWWESSKLFLHLQVAFHEFKCDMAVLTTSSVTLQ